MQNENDAVAVTKIDSLRTEMSVAGHAMIADEPAGVGGNDEGPSPYELLSAALASCTTMTLKMYASLKELPMESVTVRVRHGKIHADDCRDCESAVGKIDEFQREISFAGDLSDAQIKKLLVIADKCPVHRTLHGEIKVRTELGQEHLPADSR